MPKTSAGILAYFINTDKQPEYFLVHPGGPFFIKKDAGVWSIPKGEYDDTEDAKTVALREFEEETGNKITALKSIELVPVKIKSGKIITAWAVQLNEKLSFISSNTFTMEWPPKSGKKNSFAEVDKAEWFTIDEATVKITAGQLPILMQLHSMLA